MADPFCGLGFSYVSGGEDRAPAIGLGEALGFVASADHDIGSGLEKGFADPATDPSSSSGHQGDSALHLNADGHAGLPRPILWATSSR